MLEIHNSKKKQETNLRLGEINRNVVLVSHSFGLMKDICDRIVFIHKGEIVDVGEPDDIIKLYYEVTGSE